MSAVVIVAVVVAGCATARADASTTARPLPPPVRFRAEPEGVTLPDPAFEAVPGARADFGRLGGAVYQIEMPHRWNGRLVLFMHGFEDFRPEVGVSGPDFRRYLIAKGYAWGASSFSSTSQIAGRAADETAALWDYFAGKYRRPTRSYVTGFSMGGLATHIAAERYGNRFDGALAECGNAGQTPGVNGTADYFAAGAYAAGVTQAEFDASPDVTALIRDRMLPALHDPTVHARFENIMLDLTGGPRAFGRVGFHLEEETNWRRTELAVVSRLAPNRNRTYRLGPISAVTSAEFNRAVIRLPINRELLREFAEGSDLTGKLEMPLLAMHSTGDGEVPIEQARLLHQRVAAAGRGDLLVERVIPDASHCGFSTPEQVAAFKALVGWVEHGKKPTGTNVMVGDLRKLDRTFELAPRPESSKADTAVGSRDRATVRGSATLDGAPFDARWIGAVVRKHGLVTPCNSSLPPVTNGHYEVSVRAATEASGCGGPGSEILLWTFAQDTKMYSSAAVPWPGKGDNATLDARFSTATANGDAPSITEINGEVFRRDGRHLPPRTRVVAFVGDTRCGVASVQSSGNFAGYIMSVVGPEAVPGCDRGSPLTFTINGRRAVGTAVNDPATSGTLDLTLR